MKPEITQLDQCQKQLGQRMHMEKLIDVADQVERPARNIQPEIDIFIDEDTHLERQSCIFAKCFIAYLLY
jgi:hypothetical protein